MSQKTEVIKGETSTGFGYEISQENLNNYELVEALGEMEDNPLVIAKIVNLLLGKEQADNLKNHVRIDGGTVPTDKMSDEIKEIFESQKETKNS